MSEIVSNLRSSSKSYSRQLDEAWCLVWCCVMLCCCSGEDNEGTSGLSVRNTKQGETGGGDSLVFSDQDVRCISADG